MKKEEGVGNANDMAPIPDNPSKKIKFCEPLDPQEAVEHFNWKMIDFGGNGDCFYRCVSYFVEKKAPVKHDGAPDPEKAKAAGAWTRSRAVEHAKRHKTRIRQLFDSDRSFEAFLNKSMQPTSWIEGRMMQAVSERQFRDGIWTRLIVAGKFDTNGYACAGKGLTPIVVVLRDKHYQVLQCPQGKQIPNSWWKETPSVVIDLSGGVNTRASSNGTPSLHSFSPVGSCREAKSLAAVPPRKKLVPPLARRPCTLLLI